MEAELNIAEILKNKPSGTKLYADAFGELKLERVSTSAICTRTKEGTLYTFYNNGKYDKNGESILVPSKEMRDWRKFSWKKGNVLVSNDYSTEVIFDKWYDDTYTSFYCKHYLNSENKNKIVYYEEFLCTTARYSLEDKDAAKTYINTIEERLGGKLNLETLEIKKQSKKKEVVNLKLKIELKPFDKIVGFEEFSKQWVCDMFSHYSKNYEGKEIISAIGGCTYIKALPFNEETAKLIGTSDNWEE